MQLPSLRERNDIIEIAQHLLKNMNVSSKNLSNEAKKKTDGISLARKCTRAS